MLGSSHAFWQYKIGHTTTSGQRVTKREIKGKEECYKRYINSIFQTTIGNMRIYDLGRGERVAMLGIGE